MFGNLHRISPLHPQLHADGDADQVQETEQLQVEVYGYGALLSQAS